MALVLPGAGVEVEGRALGGAAEMQFLAVWRGEVVALTLRLDECTEVPRFPLRGGFSEKLKTLAVSRPLPDCFPDSVLTVLVFLPKPLSTSPLSRGFMWHLSE